jgi:hypothetical protein
MSAFIPKGDIVSRNGDVCFVPEADVVISSAKHAVSGFEFQNARPVTPLKMARGLMVKCKPRWQAAFSIISPAQRGQQVAGL